MIRFSAVKQETIDDVKKNIKMRIDEFYNYSVEELQKYPAKIESTIAATKNVAPKEKKKKKKGEKKNEKD
jgi:hypothetical protein